MQNISLTSHSVWFAGERANESGACRIVVSSMFQQWLLSRVVSQLVNFISIILLKKNTRKSPFLKVKMSGSLGTGHVPDHPRRRGTRRGTDHDGDNDWGTEHNDDVRWSYFFSATSHSPALVSTALLQICALKFCIEGQVFQDRSAHNNYETSDNYYNVSSNCSLLSPHFWHALTRLSREHVGWRVFFMTVQIRIREFIRQLNSTEAPTTTTTAFVSV